MAPQHGNSHFCEFVSQPVWEYLQKYSNQYTSLYPSAWGHATSGGLIVKPMVTSKHPGAGPGRRFLLKSKHSGEGPCAKGQGWLQTYIHKMYANYLKLIHLYILYTYTLHRHISSPYLYIWSIQRHDPDIHWPVSRVPRIPSLVAGHTTGARPLSYSPTTPLICRREALDAGIKKLNHRGVASVTVS